MQNMRRSQGNHTTGPHDYRLPAMRREKEKMTVKKSSRTEVVILRMSKQEKRSLEKDSRSMGQTKSAFIRLLLNQFRITQKATIK
jgi:hypothetical protein